MYHKVQRKALTCVKVNDSQVSDEVRRVVRLHSCSVWRRGGSMPVSMYHSPVKVSSHEPWIKHQWPWRSAARNWNLSSERSCSVEIEWENMCLSPSASLSVSLLFPFPFQVIAYTFSIKYDAFSCYDAPLAEASEYWPRPSAGTDRTTVDDSHAERGPLETEHHSPQHDLDHAE